MDYFFESPDTMRTDEWMQITANTLKDHKTPATFHRVRMVLKKVQEGHKPGCKPTKDKPMDLFTKYSGCPFGFSQNLEKAKL